ncbi:MAG: hypothetical protein MMC33_004245 [Icmadophila ericetorum]|nr:hypothetical protein [Icmadophila ericetorum]
MALSTSRVGCLSPPPQILGADVPTTQVKDEEVSPPPALPLPEIEPALSKNRVDDGNENPQTPEQEEDEIDNES